MIDIIIPTYGRASQLEAVAENIHESTSSDHRVVFVCERDDTDSIAGVEALPAAQLVINERTRNYAGALNTGYTHTSNPWVFTGADDLVWTTDWDLDCLAKVDDWFAVIGTNDLLNTAVLAGMHSTHSLVARDYLEAVGGVADEGPGSFYPECYDHNFCDTEFIATAKMRARFRPCLDAVVEHLHVTTGKVEADATYLRSIAHYDADSRMYDMRRDVWAGLSR